MARSEMPKDRVRLVVLLAVLVLGTGAIVLTAWIREGSEAATPSSVSFPRPRSLVLHANCAGNLTARLTETGSEVRVDEIVGDVHGTEACATSVTFDLDRSLGPRALVVAGERWYRRTPDCPADGARGHFGPVHGEVPAACLT